MKKTTKIIFDTDIGCDCDDAGAMAVLHELANQGECELLATTHCFSAENGATCIDAINRFFGRSELPVGTFHPEDRIGSKWHDVYAGAITSQFAHRFPKGYDYPGTLEVLRKALANAEDGSVTVLATGSLYSLSRLLESSGDQFSPLSGVELVRRKVNRAVIMGGRFHQQWPEPIVLADGYVVNEEFNIVCDVPAAQTVCRLWPADLIFCSYEIGLPIHTGVRMQTQGRAENPVHAAYCAWAGNSGSVGRESWDLTTALYAVRPDAGYWKLHEFGKIRIDDAGVTTWHRDAGGRHSFLLEQAPLQEIQDVLNALLDADQDRAHD